MMGFMGKLAMGAIPAALSSGGNKQAAAPAPTNPYGGGHINAPASLVTGSFQTKNPYPSSSPKLV